MRVAVRDRLTNRARGRFLCCQVEEELVTKKDEEGGAGGGAQSREHGGGGGPDPNAAFTVLTQAFTLTFLAEWGDRSQIATIALAAAKDPIGVTAGGIVGHSCCTGIAVVGGRMLAARISEKAVACVARARRRAPKDGGGRVWRRRTGARRTLPRGRGYIHRASGARESAVVVFVIVA